MNLKSYLLASAALLAGAYASAQVSHIGHDHHPGEPCISHHVLNEQLQDPEVRARYEAYQESLLRYVNDPNTPVIREGGKRIIPVVVHILQKGGSENITKQKVLQQIESLNRDFQRFNTDSNNTPVRFRDVVGRMDVEFRLATKDPMGNCTDGIVRVFTDNTVDVRDQHGFKALSYWNAYSYLNIWVVQSLGGGGGGGTILGYAQFPGTGLMSTDGIAVIASRIGMGGQGGRTATHEVGHWLNLIHIWGDAQCGTDQVDDTPIAEEPNFGVCGNVGQPNHSSPYNLGVCDSENPEGEMFCNYMDYSDDNCINMFSAGQVERMNAVLDGNSDGPGYRSFMVSAENLEATGTADPYDYDEVTCAPISLFHFNNTSFYATTAMICEGDDVDFRANAYNADVDDFAWSFPGGDPGTSDVANPSVDYNTAGSYDVTLTVSNGAGSDSHTMPGMVHVSSNTAQFQSDWGYYDTFWQEEGFLDNYLVFNHDNTSNKWEFYSGIQGGSTGDESVRMLNFDNVVGRVDELVSPSYNLSTIDNPKLKFRWSGAARNSSPNDELRIYFSSNCGRTWTPISSATKTGLELVNSGVVSSSYVPNGNSIWTDEEVNLNSTAANSDNLRIKFQWTSGGGGGNNFYIDDVTISNAPVSVADLEEEIGLSIAPNPTSNTTSINMVLLQDAKVEMSMMDLTGRKVMDVNAGQMASGAHRFDVDMTAFTPGIYMLRVAIDNGVIVKKVVRN